MKATLGGFPLLGGASISWSLRDGTSPVIQEFEVAPADAISLKTGGKAVTLILDTGETGQTVRVTNLWVLSIMPGPDPYVSRVQVADRRWFWSYPLVRRFYNIRRQVGTKRLIANNQVVAVNPTAAAISYWDWSLNKGLPWVASDMIKDLFNGDDGVLKAEKEYAGTTASIIIDTRIGDKIRSLPIEDLAICENGDSAVNRAIRGYLPEAMVYIDYNGNVVVTSKATGDEKGIIQGLLPEIQGEGHTDLVDNSTVRPSAIRVLFDRKFELPFDFSEQRSAQTTTTEAGPSDRRVIRNVLPLPDYQTSIDGQTFAQGTYALFDKAMVAWGVLPFMQRGGQSRIIDHDLLQRAFVPGMDLWAALHLSGNLPDQNGVIKPWVARVNACMANYRQTFQVDPAFMNRLTGIEATRITTIDPVFGTFAPASAYGDYSVLYTQQTLIKAASQGVSPNWIINKTAYPDGGLLDATAEVSPAEVTVLNSDQGVIHVSYKPDPIFGMNETILPSQVALDSMPTADISNRSKPISFDSAIAALQPPRLSPSFKLIVVMSAYAATPNSSKQLHKIEVRPNDISNMIPDSQATGISNSQGPIMDVYIGRGVEVARVQWLDSRKTDIEKALGITEGEPDLSGLVINEGATSDLQNGASLNAIAKATAARIYASLADRFQGTATGYLNGGTVPGGWIADVTHRVGEQGDAVTTVTMPESVPQFNLSSFLDSTTRAMILKLAKPM